MPGDREGRHPKRFRVKEADVRRQRRPTPEAVSGEGGNAPGGREVSTPEGEGNRYPRVNRSKPKAEANAQRHCRED